MRLPQFGGKKQANIGAPNPYGKKPASGVPPSPLAGGGTQVDIPKAKIPAPAGSTQQAMNPAGGKPAPGATPTPVPVTAPAPTPGAPPAPMVPPVAPNIAFPQMPAGKPGINGPTPVAGYRQFRAGQGQPMGQAPMGTPKPQVPPGTGPSTPMNQIGTMAGNAMTPRPVKPMAPAGPGMPASQMRTAVTGMGPQGAQQGPPLRPAAPKAVQPEMIGELTREQWADKLNLPGIKGNATNEGVIKDILGRFGGGAGARAAAGAGVAPAAGRPMEGAAGPGVKRMNDADYEKWVSGFRPQGAPGAQAPGGGQAPGTPGTPGQASPAAPRALPQDATLVEQGIEPIRQKSEELTESLPYIAQVPIRATQGVIEAVRDSDWAQGAGEDNFEEYGTQPDELKLGPRANRMSPDAAYAARVQRLSGVPKGPGGPTKAQVLQQTGISAAPPPAAVAPAQAAVQPAQAAAPVVNPAAPVQAPVAARPSPPDVQRLRQLINNPNASEDEKDYARAELAKISYEIPSDLPVHTRDLAVLSFERAEVFGRIEDQEKIARYILKEYPELLLEEELPEAIEEDHDPFWSIAKEAILPALAAGAAGGTATATGAQWLGSRMADKPVELGPKAQARMNQLGFNPQTGSTSTSAANLVPTKTAPVAGPSQSVSVPQQLESRAKLRNAYSGGAGPSTYDAGDIASGALTGATAATGVAGGLRALGSRAVSRFAPQVGAQARGAFSGLAAPYRAAQAATASQQAGRVMAGMPTASGMSQALSTAARVPLEYGRAGVAAGQRAFGMLPHGAQGAVRAIPGAVRGAAQNVMQRVTPYVAPAVGVAAGVGSIPAIGAAREYMNPQPQAPTPMNFQARAQAARQRRSARQPSAGK